MTVNQCRMCTQFGHWGNRCPIYDDQGHRRGKGGIYEDWPVSSYYVDPDWKPKAQLLPDPELGQWGRHRGRWDWDPSWKANPGGPSSSSRAPRAKRPRRGAELTPARARPGKKGRLSRKRRLSKRRSQTEGKVAEAAPDGTKAEDPASSDESSSEGQASLSTDSHSAPSVADPGGDGDADPESGPPPEPGRGPRTPSSDEDGERPAEQPAGLPGPWT